MKRLFNFRPAVIIPLSYALGVAVIYLVGKSLTIPAILVSFIPVIIAVVSCFFVKKNRYGILLFAVVCEIVLALGSLNVGLRFEAFKVKPFTESGVTVTARYVGRGQYGSYLFDSAKFSAGGMDVSGEEFDVFTDLTLPFEYGDIVTFTATVEAETFSRESLYNDFDAFLNDDDFSVYPEFATTRIIGRRVNLFENLRLSFEKVIYKGMGEDEAAVAIAMLFGDKEEMSYDIIKGTRYSGVAHIFAVSGLHVGFVSMAISFLLSKLKAKRWISCLISIAFTFIYCGVCGFTPSAMRAFLMFCCYSVFRALGEKHDMLNSISLSAIILLIINPKQLYMPGFLMSYAAVISISVYAHPISRGLRFLPENLNSNISSMLSAQLGALPLSILYFSYTSAISTVLNFLLVPIVSLFFGLEVILVLLSTVFSYPGLLFLPDIVNGLLVRLMVDIDYSYFLITGKSVAILTLFYYAALVFSSDVFNLKFGVKLTVAFLASAIVILFSQLFISGVL